MFFSGRVQKLEQRTEKLQIHGFQIHSSKKHYQILPLLKQSAFLLSFAFPEENACDLTMP